MACGFNDAQNAENEDNAENLQQNLVAEGYGGEDDAGADQAEMDIGGEVSSGSAEIGPGLQAPAVTATQDNQADDEQQPPQGYENHEQLGGSGEEAEQDEQQQQYHE